MPLMAENRQKFNQMTSSIMSIYNIFLLHKLAAFAKCADARGQGTKTAARTTAERQTKGARGGTSVCVTVRDREDVERETGWVRRTCKNQGGEAEVVGGREAGTGNPVSKTGATKRDGATDTGTGTGWGSGG